VLVAPLGELAALEREWLGEVTIVIEASSGAGERESDEPVDVDREIAGRLAKGESPRDLSIELARRLGVPRRSAYERILVVRGKG
jgi:16S rRNA (cytidine1402-2'-O)-methyltransferase